MHLSNLVLARFVSRRSQTVVFLPIPLLSAHLHSFIVYIAWSGGAGRGRRLETLYLAHFECIALGLKPVSTCVQPKKKEKKRKKGATGGAVWRQNANF